MNREKVIRNGFWFWYGAVLFAAWILILFCDRNFTDHPVGWLYSVFGWGILAGIPASILLLTKSRILEEKVSRYWLIPAGVGAAFWVGVCSSMLGAVSAICPFDVWQRERTVFWDRFLRGYQDDLASAAERMMSPDMIGDIEQLIGFILLPYRLFSRLGLYSGSILLILSVLPIAVIRRNKNTVRFSCAGMLTGLLLFGFGVFNRSFSDCTQRRLDAVLRLQQECMKKMQAIRPAVSPEQVRKLIEAHAAQKTFGDPYWTLLRKIEGKKD